MDELTAKARELGFSSVEDMDAHQDAANHAADPADSLYAEMTGEIDPPSPAQDMAVYALRMGEIARKKRLADSKRGAADSHITTATDQTRLLMRRGWKQGKAIKHAVRWHADQAGVTITESAVKKRLQRKK